MPRNTPSHDVALTDDEQEHLFAIIHKGVYKAVARQQNTQSGCQKSDTREYPQTALLS